VNVLAIRLQLIRILLRITHALCVITHNACVMRLSITHALQCFDKSIPTICKKTKSKNNMQVLN